jgi:hypothetical protein
LWDTVQERIDPADCTVAGDVVRLAGKGQDKDGSLDGRSIVAGALPRAKRL